jgi:3-deoxy-D-manno-octulosonic-acid transferase
MFMAVYSSLLAMALGGSAPWWLWRMATSGRYREGLGERLGLVPAGFRAAVAGKKTAWVHAVSVGEVLAVERLVAELRTALPGYVIAVSTTTATGQKIARERFVDSPVFYFPLDFAFAVRAWLRVLRPSLMVLVESEFWPRHLAECERAGVPVAVVNARVSDRSLPRYMRLRWLWRRVFAKVRLFLAQGEESAERLRAIGAEAERVVVSGNLKYDLKDAASTAVADVVESVRNGRKMVVAGSTCAGTSWTEEGAILHALDRIWKMDSSVLLVLAPRHPDRFPLFEWRSLERDIFPATWLREGRQWREDPCQIILLDTIGDLAAVYRLASVAFVGGSLVPKGGHNPLEAARFGVPVVMGDSYENFREIIDGMRSAQAIRIVNGDDGSGTPARLADALEELLHDDGGMGRRGQSFFEARSGATRKIVEALVDLSEREA